MKNIRIEYPLAIQDQMENHIKFDSAPKRIVSLVPSISEYLADLELEEQVVGITKFCIKPIIWHQNKPKVGGTKTLYLDKIADLKPDLIIANKEENTFEQIKTLQKIYNTYISDVTTTDDMYTMMKHIGFITNRVNKSIDWINLTKEKISKLRSQMDTTRKAYYLVWNDPIMVAGNNTFINTTLKLFGFQNAEKLDRYPKKLKTELQDSDFDCILLPTEPFPFKLQHKLMYQKIFPNKQIELVDGEQFSWYGSRLAKMIK